MVTFIDIWWFFWLPPFSQVLFFVPLLPHSTFFSLFFSFAYFRGRLSDEPINQLLQLLFSPSPDSKRTVLFPRTFLRAHREIIRFRIASISMFLLGIRGRHRGQLLDKFFSLSPDVLFPWMSLKTWHLPIPIAPSKLIKSIHMLQSLNEVLY